MIIGVTKGYRKELQIEGVGFKATMQGKKLILSLGFSHPIEYLPPDEVKVSTEGATTIVVSGIDKQKVGEVAARIRQFYPPEPYKGKGIRYKGEVIRRKAGKTVA
jgi:large subunit ribosomal protein L6